MIALALVPLFAFGQDANELETVKVTGSRPESLNQGYSTDGTYAPLGIGMTLRETPQSVSVTTSKQMEDWKLDSLRKVMEQTNGVTVKSGSGGSASRVGRLFGYFIRMSLMVVKVENDSDYTCSALFFISFV